MKEFPETGCYCDWVTFKPCPYCQMNFDFGILNKREQVVCINYKRILNNNKEPSKDIINEINSIHEKYSGFTVYDIP